MTVPAQAARRTGAVEARDARRVATTGDGTAEPAMNPGDELRLLQETVLRVNAAPYEVAKQVVRQARLEPSTLLCRGDSKAAAARYGALAAALARNTVFDGGVYDASGAAVPLAVHCGGGRRHVPAPRPDAGPAEHLSGTWLFGGVFHRHPGHFLTESLGRLWLAPRMAGRLAGVVWLMPGPLGPKAAERAPAIIANGFATQMLGLLGIEGPHRGVVAPVTVDRLVVPAQLMMNHGGPPIAGHAAFRNFARALLAASGAADQPGGDRVYVSRAGLGTNGRFLLEEHIESTLAQAGWIIMRPETLPVAEQVRVYARASHLVFAEGSAMHLFALVARPSQKAAVIFRRKPPKRKFGLQLRGAGVREVHEIDAVRGLFAAMAAEDGPGAVPNQAVSLLDFDAVGRALAEAGFLRPGEWISPDPAAIDAAARAMLSSPSDGPPVRFMPMHDVLQST